MNEIPNRRQRRALAKGAGLLRKNNEKSFKDQAELRQRSTEFGKQIHLSNMERVLREQDAKQLEKQQLYINKLINDGYTNDEAMSIVQGENDSD